MMIKVNMYNIRWLKINIYISEINDCLPNPCHNGAVCNDVGADFRCNCVAGYTGKRCDTG